MIKEYSNYILIISLFLASIYVLFPMYVGPNNLLVNKSKGEKNEGVNVLLSRLEWTSDTSARFPTLSFYFFQAVIVTFMITKMSNFNSLQFLQSVIICFVFLLIINNFFNYHSMRFSARNVKENVRYIRQKLNLQKKNNLKINTLSSDVAWE